MGLLDKALEQSKINSLDSSDIKDVGEACNELDNVRQAIQNKEAEIKQLTDREFQLENEVIPSFFEKSGVSSITLTDGSKVSIKDRLRANITDENEDYCYDKLREFGLGDVIKNKVELIFGKGQDSDASNLMTELQDRGLYPSNKLDVAWNTLDKVVNELIEKGSMSSADQEKFGVWTFKKVKIERKK
tara:strand:+ start:873 stop:1436 length:564 start_codon:yes stop_codon:yes gene_type:complete